MDDKVRVLRAGSASDIVAMNDPVVAQVRAVSNDGLIVESAGKVFNIARIAAEVARVRPDELPGKDVLVVFERGDAALPIAVSVLHSAPLIDPARSGNVDGSAMHAQLDDDELVLSARRKIRLQCGKASITISRDGKIILRGTNLLSRSSGPLRIKGGHVEIN